MAEDQYNRGYRAAEAGLPPEKARIIASLRSYGQRVLKGVAVSQGDRSRMESSLRDVNLEACHGDLPTLKQRAKKIKEDLDGIEYRWVATRFAEDDLEDARSAREQMFRSLVALQSEIRRRDQAPVRILEGSWELLQSIWNEVICVDVLLRQRQYGRAARFQARASRRLESAMVHVDSVLADSVIITPDARLRFRTGIYRLFEGLRESLERTQAVLEDRLDGRMTDDKD